LLQKIHSIDSTSQRGGKAWKALRQCLKSGGKLGIYSTPDGMRNTTYYRLTTSTQFKVFHWPSWLNSNWTAGN
jgi:hypothetical protein